MTQGSIRSQEESHSRASSITRSSRGRNSRNDTRTPSPTSLLRRHPSNQEHHYHDQDQDLDLDLDLEPIIPAEETSPSSDVPSFLGSVWNLFREAKDVASRELDKLLDHFPYKDAARPHGTTEEDSASTLDRVLTVRKPGSSTTVFSESSSAHPPKSFLGHGPPTKPRGQSSKHRHRTLTKRLLDQGLKDHVNDVSPVKQLRASTSTPTRLHPGHNKNFIKRTHHHSNVHSDTNLMAGQPPPHTTIRMDYEAGAAKRSRRPSVSESDTQSITEPLSPRKRLPGDDTRTSTKRWRHPSDSVTNMHSAHHRAPHQPHTHHTPRRDAHHMRQHSHPIARTKSPRYSLLGESLEHGLDATRAHSSPAIYPHSQENRAKSVAEFKHHPSPFLSTVVADSLNNPFVTSRGPSPLPSMFMDASPEQHFRHSTGSTSIESEKLNELQQELAAIKEQLRSLVSAREDEQYRLQYSPIRTSSPVPPPPPPPSSLGQSRKWTPLHSDATRSMQNVLKELSSSKIQLRKTGSPFVSRISSQIDDPSSSKYTSVAIRSKSESDTPSKDTSTLSPTDVSSVPTAKVLSFDSPLAAAVRNGLELSEGSDEDLQWHRLANKT
ncbi:hypothetical protein BC939DRAFT_455840 [Gamsiella multidivaricata]|uniref:uncharacterized protein n=1 Tax=Gamsiella multidivaricata TaxID=101098 RepID=UPI0022212ABD|nr:uncharacterized protein BC939DRAFT_455840 [Gamsiella multidivaricata]KAI7821380.1 hypothetical protein BC939DRAFT_455840 [Gamsiella multidivaricata]